MSIEEGAIETARNFVHAISFGEHTTIWTLMSETGQGTALSVALANGLDRVLASRIQDLVAETDAMERFLADLLTGLRRDLRSVEIDGLMTGEVTELDAGRTCRVALLSPSSIPGTGHWPAGSLTLSRDIDGHWLVDHLAPVIAGP